MTTVQEARWLAGVNRQAQPTAQQHQVAASQAAAAKRKAVAMTAEERKAKRAEHAKDVRAEKAAAKATAAAAAAAAAAAEAAAAAAAAAHAPDREQLNGWLRAQQEKECEQEEWLEFSRIICKDYQVSTLNEIDKKKFEQRRFVRMFLHDWRATDEWMWWRMEQEPPQVQPFLPPTPPPPLSLLTISCYVGLTGCVCVSSQQPGALLATAT